MLINPEYVYEEVHFWHIAPLDQWEPPQLYLGLAVAIEMLAETIDRESLLHQTTASLEPLRRAASMIRNRPRVHEWNLVQSEDYYNNLNTLLSVQSAGYGLEEVTDFLYDLETRSPFNIVWASVFILTCVARLRATALGIRYDMIGLDAEEEGEWRGADQAFRHVEYMQEIAAIHDAIAQEWQQRLANMLAFREGGSVSISGAPIQAAKNL